MRIAHMNTVVELFGHAAKQRINWEKTVKEQQCPFLGKVCYKVRKSDPSTAIGSCTVRRNKILRPSVSTFGIGSSPLLKRIARLVYLRCRLRAPSSATASTTYP
jgi:hypothetical protein